MTNETEKSKKIVFKGENELIEALKKDEKLDKDLKMNYISMANLYLDKFEENLDKTSIDLNNDIPISIDAWKNFLNYPSVRKYIQTFRDEKITKIADIGLMEGDKGAVTIKKAMQEQGPIINNSNIVLIRLPEKVDF